MKLIWISQYKHQTCQICCQIEIKNRRIRKLQERNTLENKLEDNFAVHLYFACSSLNSQVGLAMICMDTG